MIVTTKRELQYVQSNFQQVQHKLLNKYSPAEKHFEELLVKAGLYYRREKCNFRTGTRWSYYDFYLPYYNLFVEIDGSSHDTQEQKTIDAEKEVIVRNKQKYIARFTNEEVLAMESLDIDLLLQRYFNQSARKRKRGGAEHSRNCYYKAMYAKREGAIMNIEKTAAFPINKEQEVWLYDHAIGNYFRFNSILEAKFSVEMSINEIHQLLENTVYTRSSLRRFVLAYSLEECEQRVATVYE